MSALSAARRDASRARALQFLRFCVVGVVGFLVDAAVLLAAVDLLGADRVWGRVPSFSVAVMATFELNRRWAFRGHGTKPYGAALAAYLGVQGAGFACNFAVYTALVLSLPAPAPDDASLFYLACLALASAVALLVNYLGASILVFHPARQEKDQP